MKSFRSRFQTFFFLWPFALIPFEAAFVPVTFGTFAPAADFGSFGGFTAFTGFGDESFVIAISRGFRFLASGSVLSQAFMVRSGSVLARETLAQSPNRAALCALARGIASWGIVIRTARYGSAP